MHILLVHIHVKPEFRDAFIAATLENARNSIQEEGVIRFDILTQVDNPNRFTLYEVYKAVDDHAKHRMTKHYEVWRDTVTDMMAEPRVGLKYANLFPEDSSWHK